MLKSLHFRNRLSYLAFVGLVLLTGCGQTSSGTSATLISGTGLTTDAYGDLFGGTISGYSTYGSMSLASNASVSGTTYTGSTTTYGTLQMVAQNATYGTASSSASVNGYLSLSSTPQSYITSNASSSGYGTSSTPCVSGIALQGRVYSSSSNVFTGYVYLYLNGTQHGVVLSY